ncbi:MAG: FHA domain-containing protein [Clostridia bacterium]|nr:FHA domain-containing protein [Clostridia bacterium]
MEFITSISRIVLPIITAVLLIKCILTLWLGHPKEKTYGYITDMLSGERYALNMWETSIGRGAACDINVSYDSISRVQAVITRRIDGWYIYDTLSKAGNKVNGEKINKKQTIENGDIITMGKVRFRFEIADDPVIRVGKQKKKAAKKAAEAKMPAQKAPQAPTSSGTQARPVRTSPQPAATPHRAKRPDSYTVETPKTQRKNVRRITQNCLVNKDTGEIFILCGNEVKIGTGRRCDIRLTSKHAAKLHAAVVLYEDGWAIEDAGTGKTLLNGKRVTAPQLLFDGDIIALADERLYFVVKTKTVS